MNKQTTLANPFTLQGKGLHTGLVISATFEPAAAGHGYKLQRTDLEAQPLIDCLAENVVETTRGTVLAKGQARVSTVEHALSALYALGVDNVLIKLDGPEMPILDGSAEPFAKAIRQAGIAELEAERTPYIVTRKMEYTDPESGSVITLLPDEEFSLTAMVDFPSRFISSQFATLARMDAYEEEIARARTFVFVRDIEPLLNLGLIKGGDLDNAIVIYESEISQESLDKLCDTTGAERHPATEMGYIQHRPLEWENEPARHKLLDLIGDLALIGRPIRGRVIATKPGHGVNNKFARLVRKELRKHEVQAPIYDPTRPPVFDNIAIRKLLPHRYPFQLVDKVVEIKGNTIVGLKNVTANEPFFVGHFPEEPVMPGVLQIEALAQAGGLLVLSQVDEPERWSTYFLKIDGVKFRQKVVPGDTLLFKVSLLAPIRHGISSMQGFAFVGDTCVMEATFTAQIVKNK